MGRMTKAHFPALVLLSTSVAPMCQHNPTIAGKG